MKQFPISVCLVFLLLLLQMGIASAASTATTTNATTVITTTTPGSTGGSVFFETDPAGATIWVDNNQIGTTDLTFYSEKTGKLDVFIQRKGYEDFTGNVIVIENRKVEFFAKLTPLPHDLPEETTPVVPVVTATTIRKSTLTVPTSWPETTESPIDPAIGIGAAAVGAGFFVIRRR
jgi:hypothetical protein